jgi:hypothetical protein
VAVLALRWPYRLGLLAAMVLGMAAALAVDRLLPADKDEEAAA